MKKVIFLIQMHKRLYNPCADESISSELHSFMLWIQSRCVECGSSNQLEIHHRMFRSQYTPDTMVQFMRERSKEFGKDIYWDLNSWQNLVVLCKGCHSDLHNGKHNLALKYLESFTDIANWRNIFYDKNNYEKFKKM